MRALLVTEQCYYNIHVSCFSCFQHASVHLQMLKDVVSVSDRRKRYQGVIVAAAEIVFGLLQ